MKKNNMMPVYLIILLMVGACKKDKEIILYDPSLSAIYFEYIIDEYGGELQTTKGVDSIEMSFTQIDLNLESHVVKVPIHVTGMSDDKDREYDFVIDEELTDMESEHYKIQRHIIGKGKFVDSLEIEFFKHPELQEKQKTVFIHLKSNENFELGYMNNQHIRIIVSNMLTKPSWWETWQGVMGNYSQEKMQMWMTIYHEKADPYLDYTYSYKNMPPYAMQSWYPSTFIFIRQMKEYFEKNVIYEGGDSSNPRVTLP